MVLFVSCPTSSQVSSHSVSSTTTQDFYYELTTSTTTTTTTSSNDFVSQEKSKSQPIPIRNGGGCWDDDHSTSPLERLPSPLATSAESVDSIKSSCSSRSSAERELERQQRRQLLDMGLGKLRGQSNMPLRKHLLLFNSVKALQRDLDTLDDEELYCSLVGMSSSNESAVRVADMEVDECSWLKQRCFDSGAPLKQEEQKTQTAAVGVIGVVSAASFANVNDEGFEIDEIEMMDTHDANPVETKTWSWSNESSLFDSPNESKSQGLFDWCSSGGSDVWLDSSNSMNHDIANDSSDTFSLFGFGGGDQTWSRHASCESAHRFDLWGAADPLGSGRFDLQYLFPSQHLLLQA